MSLPLPVFVLSALLFLAASFSVEAANFYINAAGARGDGSGASAENAADASPGKYNAIVQARKTPGTVIVYAPGTYYDFPALPMYSGVTHQGAGVDSTIIKICRCRARSTRVQARPTAVRFARS